MQPTRVDLPSVATPENLSPARGRSEPAIPDPVAAVFEEMPLQFMSALERALPGKDRMGGSGLVKVNAAIEGKDGREADM